MVLVSLTWPDLAVVDEGVHLLVREEGQVE